MLLARVSQKKSDSRCTVVCASTMLLKTTATFRSSAFVSCIAILRVSVVICLPCGRDASCLYGEGVTMDRLHLSLDKWELSY